MNTPWKDFVTLRVSLEMQAQARLQKAAAGRDTALERLAEVDRQIIQLQSWRQRALAEADALITPVTGADGRAGLPDRRRLRLLADHLNHLRGIDQALKIERIEAETALTEAEQQLAAARVHLNEQQLRRCRADELAGIMAARERRQAEFREEERLAETSLSASYTARRHADRLAATA